MNRRFIVVMVGSRLNGFTDLDEAVKEAERLSGLTAEEVRVLVQQENDPGAFNLHSRWRNGEQTESHPTQ